MTTVLDSIPTPLQPEVDLALSWFNTREADAFEVTGIVDPPQVAGTGGDLRLVLCGAGTCRQETFRVGAGADGTEVTWLGEDQSRVSGQVAELDPPPGALRQWIDEITQRHAFAVVLFYRGFW